MMDKNAIKKYAVWARRELITRVSGRAAQYGVTGDGWGDANADSVNGHVLSATEKKQRNAFITKVKNDGYEQAVEEVAYTWFNRFCALRYMEVNGYIPSHVRVFTNEVGEFKPEIIDEALHLDIEGLDMDKVLSLKEDAQKTEELFRYLLITQCNALNTILPGIFQKIEDYTELLLPENLLREGSVIEQMITQIPEEDWTDQVQIIGWLYQYYNAEKKDEVFAALKKNVKITKENIPAATQLFTPDWIVRYMVENSLGRLWVEGHPNDELKSGWKYYLEEAEQEPEVETQLAEIRKEYAKLEPEDIRCIDPCCGSGHILCYMFDVLMQIYESYGYTAQEAVSSIVENNLYGLDIDERAAQLAYFAVMIKARSYDRRFFNRGIQPHVYAICESNDLDQNVIDYFIGNDPRIKKDFETLVEELHDAKEYGSILNISMVDFTALYKRIEEIKHDINFYTIAVLDEFLPLIRIADILANKYDVVITNPPYMGVGNMNAKLSDFIKGKYPNSKSDLSTVCMERALQMCKANGYMGMINIPVWMSLSSFDKLRINLLSNNIICTMVQPGRGIFGSDFGTTAFVICKSCIKNYKGSYYRLFSQQGEVKSPEEREQTFLSHNGFFATNQDNFFKIPGVPVAYWVSSKIFDLFENPMKVTDYGKPLQGSISGDNARFLRLWFEVSVEKIKFDCTSEEDTDKAKWFPHIKGGEYRKWFGNQEYVINWEHKGHDIKNFYDTNGKLRSRPQNNKYFFKGGITWSDLTIGKFSARITSRGFTFDATGPTLVLDSSEYTYYMLAYFNSSVFQVLLDICCGGIHYNNGVIAILPVLQEKNQQIEELSKKCVEISKVDWDSFENSWNFKRDPLVCNTNFIADAYNKWANECNARFIQLKENEEEINRNFINICNLKDELTSEEEDKSVTIHKADLQRDIKGLISYAVGCMFGRYSLDVDGLAYAGGEWDASKYKTYQPDYNGILPICDDEYFTDDIVGHFVDFIRTVYGEDTLEENLQFIADALGGSGSSREVIRKYFLNDFFADHCKTYQKRPIYWLFDSGKKNGFKCLIYMHRYRPDTIARIRTDYVHEQQARYRTAIADVEKRVANASTSDRIKLNKQLKKLQDQSDELLGYEEKIHHLADQFIDIDLDDGVKVNYAKFQDVLAKIK